GVAAGRCGRRWPSWRDAIGTATRSPPRPAGWSRRSAPTPSWTDPGPIRSPAVPNPRRPAPNPSAEELVLLLGPRPPRRLRAWLHDALAAAIRDGRLPAGVRLPSTRAVAAGLGSARGPVTEAVERLTAEGYLITRGRSGSTAAPRAAAIRPDRPEVTVRPPPSPGTPDPTLFPWPAWRRALRNGTARLRPDDLGYGDPRGLADLRERIAELLRL